MHGITTAEIRDDLSRLYLDVAASGADALIGPAVSMVGVEHLVYGSDSGTPCTEDTDVDGNITNLETSAVLALEQANDLGPRAFNLFPEAARRAGVTS